MDNYSSTDTNPINSDSMSDNTSTDISSDKSDNIYNKKYPKSKSGKQCLTPCYKANTDTIHPTTLAYISGIEHPFCAIQPYETKHPKTGETVIRDHDECYVPFDKKDITQKELEMNILLPKIDFDCTNFLKIYYDSYSFEDIFIWFSKHVNTPVTTKLRIIECAWSAYGNNIDVVSDSVVKFYIKLIKKMWIRDIYQHTKQYIVIKNSSIYLRNGVNIKDNRGNKYRIEKTNYIIDKFITKNNIYKFLTNYIKKYKDSWDQITSHNKNLKYNFINFILTDVKNKISKK
jgi:hypothetical protein